MTDSFSRLSSSEGDITSIQGKSVSCICRRVLWLRNTRSKIKENGISATDSKRVEGSNDKIIEILEKKKRKKRMRDRSRSSGFGEIKII